MTITFPWLSYLLKWFAPFLVGFAPMQIHAGIRMNSTDLDGQIPSTSEVEQLQHDIHNGIRLNGTSLNGQVPLSNTSA